jgi:hypothetical protein
MFLDYSGHQIPDKFFAGGGQVTVIQESLKHIF